MSRPEDHFTNYPEDAAAYEHERAAVDYVDDRPTRQEIESDERDAYLPAVEHREAS